MSSKGNRAQRNDGISPVSPAGSNHRRCARDTRCGRVPCRSIQERCAGSSVVRRRCGRTRIRLRRLAHRRTLRRCHGTCPVVPDGVERSGPVRSLEADADSTQTSTTPAKSRSNNSETTTTNDSGSAAPDGSEASTADGSGPPTSEASAGDDHDSTRPISLVIKSLDGCSAKQQLKRSLNTSNGHTRVPMQTRSSRGGL